MTCQGCSFGLMDLQRKAWGLCSCTCNLTWVASPIFPYDLDDAKSVQKILMMDHKVRS